LKLKGSLVARPRNTPDKKSPGASETESRDEPEDAVIVEDPGAPKSEAVEPGMEETAPEASPEIGATDEVIPEQAQEDQKGDPAPEKGDDPAPEEGEPERSQDAAAEAPDEAAPSPEPVAEETRPAPAPPPSRSGASIALPLFFGGIVAALVGFAASRAILPEGWPGQGDTDAVLAELRAAADTQTARISELESALAALREDVDAAPDPTSAVAALQDDLGGRIATATEAASQASDRLGEVSQQLGDLAARVDELAMRPIPEGLDPASLDAELSQFRDELSAAVDAARSQIVGAQEEAAAIAARAAEQAAAEEAAAAEAAEATRAAAEEAAEAAVRQAALSRILAAMESGEPYAEDLASLGASGVPDALAAAADDGVPTMKALAERFPEAARAALDASIRAEAGEGAMDRLTAFLRVQTGARSLEPREGDDPDAVLSRAEAAVRDGDLEAALAELAALPEAGLAEMAGWIQSARTRLDALGAVQGLSQD
jgi:hypothetical protein